MFSPVYSNTLRDGGLEVSIRDTPRPLIRLTIFDAISVIVACIFSAGQLPELARWMTSSWRFLELEQVLGYVTERLWSEAVIRLLRYFTCETAPPDSGVGKIKRTSPRGSVLRVPLIWLAVISSLALLASVCWLPQLLAPSGDSADESNASEIFQSLCFSVYNWSIGVLSARLSGFSLTPEGGAI